MIKSRMKKWGGVCIFNARDHKCLQNADRTPESLEADERIILKRILEA
jgi:hypothetical protein